MRELLIICTTPFGQLTDMAKWCENIPSEVKVRAVCLKNRQSMPQLKPNINLIEVPVFGIRFFKGIVFILYSIFNIAVHKGPILVEYFSGCAIFKILFPRKKMVVDVRTLAVWGGQDDYSQAIRDKYDNTLRKTVKRYDALAVISEGVKQRIGNVRCPVYFLPLGSDVISDTPKDYTSFNILYVGGLYERSLDHTIKGVKIFMDSHPDVTLHYDIVGGSNRGDELLLNNLAKSLNIQDYVTLHGRVEHHLLKPFFDKCSYGVSYVPITPFYNIQPPTKTYEYAMSGLVVLGTATTENMKVINEINGVLFKDTPETFAKGLEKAWDNRYNYKEPEIRESLSEYTWSNIMTKYFMPIFNGEW